MNTAQAQIRTSTAPLKETTASVGVAGPNTWNVIGNVTAAVGIAGNPSRQRAARLWDFYVPAHMLAAPILVTAPLLLRRAVASCFPTGRISFVLSGLLRSRIA